MIMAILNINMIIIGTIIIYNVPTMCGHRGTLTDTRGTITVIIVVATDRTVRRGGAFSAIITVTRSVVISTGHNINSSIIIRISTGIVMVSVTVDLG